MDLFVKKETIQRNRVASRGSISKDQPRTNASERDFDRDDVFNNLCRPSPPTPLIRGERNYFPEGVFHTRNLHTSSVYSRSHLLPFNSKFAMDTSAKSSIAPLDNFIHYNNEDAPIGMKQDFSSSSSYNSLKGNILPENHKASQPYYDRFQKRDKRLLSTAGDSSSSLGHVVPVKAAGNGHITFHQEVSQWLNDVDSKGSKEDSRQSSESLKKESIHHPHIPKESLLDDSRYFNASLSLTEEEVHPVHSKDDFSTTEGNCQYDIVDNCSQSKPMKYPRKSFIEKDISSLSNTCITPNHSCTTGKEDNSDVNLKSDSFQVFLRIRPLEETGLETSSRRLRSLSVESNSQVLLCTRPSKGKESNGTKHLFTFSHVFPECTPQREIFEVTMPSVVEAVLTGHQCCVLSYGIPNSGKSYTLHGKATSGKHRGLIIRAMESMLSTVHNDQTANVKYEITTSFLQIYNERFYDILDPSASGNIKFHDSGDHSWIDGATQVTVKTIDDVSKQLRRSPNRIRDAGSRSHTVFTVKVHKEEVMTSLDYAMSDGKEKVKVTEGELRIVDLLGVERSVRHTSYDSPAVSTAEAKTTRSLQLFANLVMSLANDKDSVTSYKDSKLTRLLKNALGGDCITRFIVTSSPCPNLSHETLSTLNLAQKACVITNCPVPKITTIKREIIKNQDSKEKSPQEEDSLDSESSRRLSHSSNKLPPINPIPGQHVTNTSEVADNQMEQGRSSSQTHHGQEGKEIKENKSNESSLDNSSSNNDSEGKSSPESLQSSTGLSNSKKNPGKTKSRNASTSSPVKMTSLSSEDAVNSSDSISPDNLMYLQVKTADTLNKTISLPLLAASKTGHIVNQPPTQTLNRRTEPQTEQLSRSLSKSPNNGNARPSRRDSTTRQNRRKKSSENEMKLNSLTQTHHGLTIATNKNFAATIQPASDNIINGSDESKGKFRPVSAGSQAPSSSTKRTSPPAPKLVEVTSLTGVETVINQLPMACNPEHANVCCSSCREREDKIKSDYDRMILFSKKDRDEKRVKLDELQQEIKNLKSNITPASQLRMLEEEISLSKSEKEIQSKEISRLESFVESLKLKLSNMVSSSELATLQDLRRKEHQATEEKKQELENLKLKLKEESEKHKREMSNKNDVIKKLERDMTQLRKECNDKEKQFQDYKKQQEEKTAAASVDNQRIQARHEAIAVELNGKIASGMKEIGRMKEAETKMMKQRQEEKENFQRELALAKQTATHAQADLKIAQAKANEREHRLGKSANSQIGMNAFSTSKLAPKRNYGSRDAWTETSNSPISDKEDQCSRCSNNVNQDDVSDIRRDEELRILLLQDARNREILIQLKREKNLLCDVMKIVYCRQWFTEEAGQHIKRTLKRVGIDTRSLNMLRKKT